MKNCNNCQHLKIDFCEEDCFNASKWKPKEKPIENKEIFER